jgi:GT2 family glycosyltransferase
LQVSRSADSAASIVIGSCRDAVTGQHTYGGVRVLGNHPAKVTLVKPDPDTVQYCDTFNGNCVLVPKAAYLLLGNMTPFCHSTGDTDYGLRAKKLGIPLLLAPGYLAECSNNPDNETWRNITLPRTQRLRLLIGRKGIPPVDYWRFLWAHSGLRALLYWPRPYLRILIGR